MGTYSRQVGALLTLGAPQFGSREKPADYTLLGIGAEHIPELIRLLQDVEFAHADGDSPVVYAQVHAWRALGQLRAEAAIERMLDLLAGQEDDDHDDWTIDDLPRALGQIGPAAIAPIVARLEKRGTQEWVPCYHASALTYIAKRYPDTRTEVVHQMCRVLATALLNDPGVNGSVIANLLDLKAVEAWPAIETAFATGYVDESIAGDVANVKFELGLGPKPPPRAKPYFVNPPAQVPTAKQRAEARAKQRKAEKKKQKKRRKGK